jgi:UDP-glucose 4-epimerase
MQIEGNRFLVTGGAGFVGSHIVDRLLAADASEVVVLDLDPRDTHLGDALASGRVRLEAGDVGDRAGPAGGAVAARHPLGEVFAGVEGLFHAAVLPLNACTDDPRRCLEVNVVGTFNVFEAARDAGVKKIVFSSASSVYGDTNTTMDESHPLAARSWYGASKVCGEAFLHALGTQTGIDYVILRYMNVYGPRQDAGLVRLVLNRINSGERPIITGDGSASFDFVHVSDVAEANVRSMASDLNGIEINVGSGGEASVKEIVGHLLRLTGSDLEPEYRPAPNAAMFRRVGSNERMVELLGWEPEHDLDAGLLTVIDYVAAGR